MEQRDLSPNFKSSFREGSQSLEQLTSENNLWRTGSFSHLVFNLWFRSEHAYEVELNAGMLNSKLKLSIIIV